MAIEKQIIYWSKLFHRISGKGSDYRYCHLYAYNFSMLFENTIKEKNGWHETLTQGAIVGLGKDRPGRAIVVAYAFSRQNLMICIISSKSTSLSNMNQEMRSFPGYIEQGDDICPPRNVLRPIAYWEPPATLVRLWPTGLDGDITGSRILDTGNEIAYFTSPADAKDMYENNEYLCVPDTGSMVYSSKGKQIKYENRWLIWGD